MKKWFQKNIQRYMIRPVIYQAFTRSVMGLLAALLWNLLANRARLPVSAGCFAVGLFYTLMAWFAWLRLDGIHMPVFDRKLFLRKNKPMRAYGDMIDFVDEEPISFEDLEDREKDTCLLLSNIFCAVLFVAASFFV